MYACEEEKKEEVVVVNDVKRKKIFASGFLLQPSDVYTGSLSVYECCVCIFAAAAGVAVGRQQKRSDGTVERRSGVVLSSCLSVRVLFPSIRWSARGAHPEYEENERSVRRFYGTLCSELFSLYVV